MKEPVIMLWSGGKDSALALHDIHHSYDVKALLTTMTEDYDRISVHGVRRSLVEEQATALDYPLDMAWIPSTCTNQIYEDVMVKALLPYREQGIKTVVAGDIFLEDVFTWRQDFLAKLGFSLLAPIWQQDSRTLPGRFLSSGFKTILTCVDTSVLSGDFSGKFLTEDLLDALPSHVDPSGENGEFHTFTFDGPTFSKPVNFAVGETVLRQERWAYTDLIPL